MSFFPVLEATIALSWRRLAVAAIAAIAALAASPRAHAHEVVADSRVESTATTIDGIVHVVTIDDDTRGTTRTYRLVTPASGPTQLATGPAAAALVNGARYVLNGTSNGKVLDARSATRAAIAAPKSASVPIAASYDGILRLGHADYTDRPSEYFYAVFMANGHHKMMRDLQLIDALQNGMDVSVEGTMRDGDFTADRVVIRQYPKMLASDALQTKSTATHSVFVVPVLFPSQTSPSAVYPAEPFTVAALNNVMFGAAPVKSVAEYYKEVSYGQQILTGVVANKQSAWLGASQVPALDSKSNKQCDTDFIQQQGNAAALAAGYTNANITPGFMTPGSTSSQNHVVFVFNSAGFACGWSGLGYIGYGLAFSNQSATLLVIGHELGHTFGLYHAGSLDCGAAPIGGSCTVTEYGDPFDVMGNISGMHFNAFQKNALLWIGASGVATHTGGTASYTLAPIESPGGSKYAVKIAAGPNRTYWIEYRQPIGFDSGISVANANGAQIRVARPTEKVCSTCDAYSDDTELLDMSTATTSFADAVLPTGSRFVDTYYGVSVDILSRTATSLNLEVTSLPRLSHPDFDASATTDLLWSNSSTGQTSMSLMNGLTAKSTTTLLTDVTKAVTQTGDLDGDGKTDLIWRTTSGTTSAWLMNGATATSAKDLLSDPSWSSQFLADFDGDGKQDIVWRNSATGMTTIWLMNGVTMKSYAIIYVDPAWRITHVGDFNGDGKADLVWYNATTGMTTIWLMNGLSVLSTSIVQTSPNGWQVTHVGDLDGDGRSDLIWSNSSTGATSVWLMNGTNYSSYAVLANPGYHVTQIGDFDGDGKADLVWRNDANGATSIWLMNGTSIKASAVMLVDPNWSVTHIVDTDGDGKSDLVWKNSATGQTSLWLMDGTTMRTYAVIGATPAMSVAPPQPQ
jgi:M6 family metalloprotease-like protein